MKQKPFFILILAFTLSMLSVGIALTQNEEPVPTPDPQEGAADPASVVIPDTAAEQTFVVESDIEAPPPGPPAPTLTGFTYQGKLTAGGSPANGLYEFEFSLFDSPGAGIQIGTTMTDVLVVQNGLFTTVIDFGDVANGQLQYLEVGVRKDGSPDPFTTLFPRQPLHAAPAALTLRPGATVEGTVSNGPVFEVANEATSGTSSVGIFAETNSASGSAAAIVGRVNPTAPGGYSAGVRGINNGTGGNGIGVWGSQNGSGWGIYGTSSSGYGGYFVSSGTNGRGIYARGAAGTDADVILGGSGASDDGRITSDPGFSSSDVFIVSNDGIVLELDNDNSNEDADLEIKDKDDNTILNFDESGQLSLYEPGVGEMIEMVTTELGTDGAQITLRNTAGQATVILDAEYNAGGDGRITTEVLQITGGSDLSEQFNVAPTAGVAPQAGLVVVIDPENPGELRLSDRANDTLVAGVISGAGGVNPGLLMGQNGSEADGAHPVALTGRVYVMVDASYGAVEPGDLLTTSDTPGHAMKVSDHAAAQGAVLGKAMTGLTEGQGLVLVLVTLQ